MFTKWMQETFELFNPIVESKGIIEEQFLLNKPYKKKMEIMILWMRLDKDLKIKIYK